MAKKKTCGIVMPISECDGLGASHWSDVRKIVETVAEDAGFETRLVSDTFESNLIHKEILQNIYNDDLIICDVSGRNPNVFFELGIRMATQKPTVIIKDGVTPYPFDTGPNRYIEYPRDMRHPVMEKFKKDLAASIEKTAKQSKDNSFIGQLGPFAVLDVESTELPASDIILDRLSQIERVVSQIHPSSHPLKKSHRYRADVESVRFHPSTDGTSVDVCITGYFEDQVINAVTDLKKSILRDLTIHVSNRGEKHMHFNISGKSIAHPEFETTIREAIDNALPF